jgi:hypothetical protein
LLKSGWTLKLKGSLTFYLFIYFGGTGVWTQGFKLAKQSLCCHTSSPFCSSRWGLANYLPRLASNHNPPNFSFPSS